METYLNLDGEECVIVTNEDGSIWSGLKSAYDAEQAANKVKANEAKTK
jgi:hypothetical protein